jgi:fibronectin type 3 domain-containing protein
MITIQNLKKKLILERVMMVLMAGTVTLAWDANIEPDLAGYNIYYGIKSGDYTVSIDVKNVNEYTVQNLTPGTTYYFAATAYDDDNNESAYSIELTHTQKKDPLIKPKGYYRK